MTKSLTWKRARLFYVWQQSNGICWLCNEPVEWMIDESHHHPLAPTIDHAVPKRSGGMNTLANAKIAHRACNSARNHYEPQPATFYLTKKEITLEKWRAEIG